MTDARLTQSELETLLEAWIDIDSTSGREAAFLEALESFFTARGWFVTRQPVMPGRWNLVVLAEQAQSPALLFSTHVDTVPPFIPFRREGDLLCGRGAVDTKGGLVAMVAAAERLRHEHPLGDRVGFLLVVGEEVDHCGAAKARDLELEPNAIILCEPTRGRCVSEQKGAIKVRLTSLGQAAHSSLPDAGVSALEPLLDVLQALRQAEWPEDPVLGATTLNIGVLRAGVAANVIPPRAEADLMFRTVSPSDEVLPQLEALSAGLELTILTCDEPQTLFVPEGEAASASWQPATVAFNTDARFLKSLGPVVLVGPGDIARAHGDGEHITRAELGDGVALYVRLAAQLLDSANANSR